MTVTAADAAFGLVSDSAALQPCRHPACPTAQRHSDSKEWLRRRSYPEQSNRRPRRKLKRSVCLLGKLQHKKTDKTRATVANKAMKDNQLERVHKKTSEIHNNATAPAAPQAIK